MKKASRAHSCSSSSRTSGSGSTTRLTDVGFRRCHPEKNRRRGLSLGHAVEAFGKARRLAPYRRRVAALPRAS